MTAVNKSFVLAALAVALVASTAQAQTTGGGHKKQSAAKTDTQKPKADEKAYAAALNSLPDKKYDPWHGISR
jgi:hypothetical protein